MEEQIQYDSGLSFEKVWAMFQETDRKFQETREEIKESQKETDRQIKESQKATQKIVSDLGRKFGSVVEHLFISNLHAKFHQFGYTFGKSTENVLIQPMVPGTVWGKRNLKWAV